MPTPAQPDLIDQGLAAHEAGDLVTAERLYAAAVERTPDDADAHNLLGVCQLQRGDAAAARSSFEMAVRLDPTTAEFLFHLGRAQQALDQLPAARDSFLAALQINGDLDGAWRGLGETSQVLRGFDDAARAWRHVLEHAPNDVPVWNNLGLAELHRGNLEQAERALLEAVRLDPAFAVAWSNLIRVYDQNGNNAGMVGASERLLELTPHLAATHLQRASVLQRQGRLEDAIASVDRAVAIDDTNPDAHYALGVLRSMRSEHEAATRAFRRASELCPGNPLPDAHCAMSLLAGGDPIGAVRELQALDAKFPNQFDVKLQLAEAYGRANQPHDAVEAARQAVALRPDDTMALSQLGRLLGNIGEQTEAEQHFRRALASTPWPPAAAANLASMLALRGQLAEGLALHRELVSRFPKTIVARSNFLLHLNGDPHTPPDVIAEEHREWGRLHAPARAYRYDNDLNPDRPLRVGYLSPDFREHSVSFFFEPVVSYHERRHVTVVCYDNVQLPDRMTAHLKSLSHEWRRIVGRSDEAIADQIRRDRIDILVDLSGHTGDHRLGVFALKPAPIQVSYLGYPNTTGVPQIDYRLTDELADPPGNADAWHVETLVRLPAPFIVYRPPLDAPAVGPLPAWPKRPVTFGSFNALSKLNDHVFDLWAAVLRGVPASTFMMKANGLGDEQTRARISSEFERRNVAPDRLKFVQRTRTYGDHMNTYNSVDIALDTFPYNGTTTTCEALYMGVPVITLAGKSHVGRVSLSLLTSIGLADWVAADEAGFVGLAMAKSGDLAELATIRAGLRSRMQRSPLMAARAHVRQMEDAYRDMWKTYCRNASN